MLHSRKFWLMIADLVFSVAIYFIAKYVNPLLAEDILWLIAMIQPVIISVIAGIALEDAAEKSQQLVFYQDAEPDCIEDETI